MVIDVLYDGGWRTIEPHCHGTTTAGNPAIRVYQTGGFSRSGEQVGWKLMLVSQISGTRSTDARFAGPRPGYRKGDRGMSTIHCEL